MQSPGWLDGESTQHPCFSGTTDCPSTSLHGRLPGWTRRDRRSQQESPGLPDQVLFAVKFQPGALWNLEAAPVLGCDGPPGAVALDTIFLQVGGPWLCTIWEGPGPSGQLPPLLGSPAGQRSPDPLQVPSLLARGGRLGCQQAASSFPEAVTRAPGSPGGTARDDISARLSEGLRWPGMQEGPAPGGGGRPGSWSPPPSFIFFLPPSPNSLSVPRG